MSRMIELQHRLGKLRMIGAIEALSLGIPRRSLVPTNWNFDAVYVDHRCLKRYRRRYEPIRRAIRRTPPGHVSWSVVMDPSRW